MTYTVLLSVICQWINSLGMKAIQSPSDNPAPAGRYISVNLGNVHQHGDMLVPGPVSGTAKKYKSFMSVAQVQLYEVEGDGEWLRSIRNSLQQDSFDSFIKSKTQSTDGLDNSFSVWEIGEIIDNSTQDGAYWIRQKTMTFDVQFMDYLEHKTKRMKSVSGTLNTETFEVEYNG